MGVSEDHAELRAKYQASRATQQDPTSKIKQTNKFLKKKFVLKNEKQTKKKGKKNFVRFSIWKVLTTLAGTVLIDWR